MAEKSYRAGDVLSVLAKDSRYSDNGAAGTRELLTQINGIDYSRDGLSQLAEACDEAKAELNRQLPWTVGLELPDTSNMSKREAKRVIQEFTEQMVEEHGLPHRILSADAAPREYNEQSAPNPQGKGFISKLMNRIDQWQQDRRLMAHDEIEQNAARAETVEHDFHRKLREDQAASTGPKRTPSSPVQFMEATVNHPKDLRAIDPAHFGPDVAARMNFKPQAFVPPPPAEQAPIIAVRPLRDPLMMMPKAGLDLDPRALSAINSAQFGPDVAAKMNFVPQAFVPPPQPEQAPVAAPERRPERHARIMPQASAPLRGLSCGDNEPEPALNTAPIPVQAAVQEQSKPAQAQPDKIEPAPNTVPVPQLAQMQAESRLAQHQAAPAEQAAAPVNEPVRNKEPSLAELAEMRLQEARLHDEKLRQYLQGMFPNVQNVHNLHDHIDHSKHREDAHGNHVMQTHGGTEITHVPSSEAHGGRELLAINGPIDADAANGAVAGARLKGWSTIRPTDDTTPKEREALLLAAMEQNLKEIKSGLQTGKPVHAVGVLGVEDLSRNSPAVNAFMQKLEQEDPQLKQMLAAAMDNPKDFNKWSATHMAAPAAPQATAPAAPKAPVIAAPVQPVAPVAIAPRVNTAIGLGPLLPPAASSFMAGKNDAEPPSTKREGQLAAMSQAMSKIESVDGPKTENEFAPVTRRVPDDQMTALTKSSFLTSAEPEIPGSPKSMSGKELASVLEKVRAQDAAPPKPETRTAPLAARPNAGP